MGKNKKKNGHSTDTTFVSKDKKEGHMLVCTKSIKPKTVNQNKYFKSMEADTIVFGIGPAGSGKTLLAVYYAIQQIFLKKYDRIIVTRPVVEAGEKLGFLPGDLSEKIDPYIRPIFDAIRDILGDNKKIKEWVAEHIEVAPLAYMRGRTFNNCILLLDEAQNTTEEQMFMFITRMGMNSKAIITADPTQIDLQKKKDSGIFEALAALKNVPDINVIYFSPSEDVLRCPIVSAVVAAYTQHRNSKYKEEKIVQEVYNEHSM
jgi:phosphate starvation-inducible protein PhoH and related proteins